MKGLVFTEFIEMVEEKFGEEVADGIIEASDLASGGVYTAVGTYDHNELVQLVGRLSEATGIDAPSLIRAFGKYLFPRFAQTYPRFFDGVGSTFDFLQSVELLVHREVQKLYPDSELPSFECDCSEPNRMTLIYRSARSFADLAEGLIAGCAEHFGDDIDIEREDLSVDGETIVRFSLTCSVESLSV